LTILKINLILNQDREMPRWGSTTDDHCMQSTCVG